MKKVLIIALSLLVLQSFATRVSWAQLSIEELLSGDGLRSVGDVGMSGRDTRSQDPYILPFLGENADNRPSELEILYSERTGKPMLQFGYDVLGQGRSVRVWPLSSVQGDYVLGAGDVLHVTLRGQENASAIIRISNQGEVLFPNLEPILASGRTLDNFRVELESKVEEAFLATRAFVSISQIRGTSVLVSGDVNLPGIVGVTGLSTVIDALVLAGGVKKTGSLRRIQVHGSSGTRTIDLYAVLSGFGETPDLSLKEGERIYVPPLGRTIAVSGAVRRPGIYENGVGGSEFSVADLLSISGGVLAKGEYNKSIIEITNSGRARIVGLTISNRTMSDGEILIVEPKNIRVNELVTMTGHLNSPGAYPLSEFKSLSDLISSESLFIDQPYLLFAILSRRDPLTLSRQYIPFSPTAVLDGRFDIELAPEDVIRIFSLAEIREVTRLLDLQDAELSRSSNQQLSLGEDGVSEEILEARIRQLIQARDSGPKGLAAIIAGDRLKKDGDANQSAPDLPTPQDDTAKEDETQISDDRVRLMAIQGGGKVASSVAAQGKMSSSLPGAADAEESAEKETAYEILSNALERYKGYREINLSDPVVWQLLYESRLSILGAVKSPGNYPAAVGTRLGEALALAGGPEINADLSSIEVTTTRYDAMRGVSYVERNEFPVTRQTLGSVILSPLDVIRIRPIFSKRNGGQVAMTGELKFPGAFDIMRGERLSSVFDRAGGVTEAAYPYGAVFLRRSIAQTEQIGFNRMADEIQSQLITAMTLDDLSTGEIEYLTKLLNRMRATRALGRMSVNVDPEEIRLDPKLDITLENGDRIHIPKRPTAITVMGEVLMAGSYQFMSGTKAKDYINLAGGYSKSSDKGRTFIIYPDGTARRVNRGLFSFSQQMIAPGTTVVIPRDLTPFQFFKFATEITQITSQLAVTAASLAVIADRN